MKDNTYLPTNNLSLTVVKNNKLTVINKIFYSTLRIFLKSTIYALVLIVLNIITSKESLSIEFLNDSFFYYIFSLLFLIL